MPPPPLSISNLIVLLGPTAGGKSELAVQLAERLNGWVIGADSMQVYRYMDAGTAKPSAAARRRARHELIDIVEPRERFTVHDWLTRAEAVIAGARAADRVPIVVGGTNLYLKALLEGMFDGPGRDEAFRASLHDMPDAVLHERLAAVDPEAAARIAPADRQRLTRALEVHHLTGQPITALQTQWQSSVEDCLRVPTSDFALRTCIIGLRWPTDAINARINLRVKAMFHPARVDPALAAEVCPNGESLPEEVRRLVDDGLLVSGSQACEALGYKQTLAAFHHLREPGFDRFRGNRQIKTLDDAFERTKILTRRFAKQQRTWLKRFPTARWIDLPNDDPLGTALQAIEAGTQIQQSPNAD